MTVTEFIKAIGRKGGRARAAALTAAPRSAIARKTASARWGKPKRLCS